MYDLRDYGSSAADKDIGLCLVLKKDAGIIFGSSEGAPATAPSLTITYL